MSADLREALAEKDDELRDVYNPGERLVLFRTATPSDSVAEGFIAIDFDGNSTGIVKAGWRKERRYFERGTVARPAVKVYLSRRYTRAKLERVAFYAILTRNRTDGLWYGDVTKCDPDGGIPQTADEFAWRWLGGKIVKEDWTPTPAPPATNNVFPYTFPFELA